MQEEVTQKTIVLVFKSSRLTADVLKKAMKMYLGHRKAGKQATHGKMSVKKLVGQGMGASSIEVTDNNIKSFERVARKYNVDFAVKKDKTVEPPKGRTKRNAYCPVLCIALIAAVRCPIRRTTTKAVNPIIRSDAAATGTEP